MSGKQGILGQGNRPAANCRSRWRYSRSALPASTSACLALRSCCSSASCCSREAGCLLGEAAASSFNVDLWTAGCVNPAARMLQTPCLFSSWQATVQVWLGPAGTVLNFRWVHEARDQHRMAWSRMYSLISTLDCSAKSLLWVSKLLTALWTWVEGTVLALSFLAFLGLLLPAMSVIAASIGGANLCKMVR